MNKKALREFVQKANREGYGSGRQDNWTKEKDGSTTIIFGSGDFRMHDNFFGGEPYAGREVVFLKNAAVWMMVYYGKVIPGQDIIQVYKVIQLALSNAPDEMPVRGPKVLEDGEFRYTNEWKGNLEEFSGEESITKSDKLVYSANYIGGLVDQQKEE
ncbi:hypothetical protein HYT32_00390 [Candidatus Roizmanbacteria bacterium]|nr:hypothetical protein [Candidatus Roizmanbacteria bacterium]